MLFGWFLQALEQKSQKKAHYGLATRVRLFLCFQGVFFSLLFNVPFKGPSIPFLMGASINTGIDFVIRNIRISKVT
jgi:hypothetical protein